MSTEHVWVMETGDYEQRFVSGVYSSPEVAFDILRETYRSPYVVTWNGIEVEGEDYATITGQFEAVQGLSTKHASGFELTRYEIDAKENA